MLNSVKQFLSGRQIYLQNNSMAIPSSVESDRSTERTVVTFVLYRQKGIGLYLVVVLLVTDYKVEYSGMC